MVVLTTGWQLSYDRFFHHAHTHTHILPLEKWKKIYNSVPLHTGILEVISIFDLHNHQIETIDIFTWTLVFWDWFLILYHYIDRIDVWFSMFNLLFELK
jgi:hypothetical protein